jgi:hypothetical protein
VVGAGVDDISDVGGVLDGGVVVGGGGLVVGTGRKVL